MSESTKAAPPDAGGHQGSTTRPDELLAASPATPAPELNQDPAWSGAPGSLQAVLAVALVLFLTAAVAALVFGIGQ